MLCTGASLCNKRYQVERGYIWIRIITECCVEIVLDNKKRG
jgi:hypothetical protein